MLLRFQKKSAFYNFCPPEVSNSNGLEGLTVFDPVPEVKKLVSNMAKFRSNLENNPILHPANITLEGMTTNLLDF